MNIEIDLVGIFGENWKENDALNTFFQASYVFCVDLLEPTLQNCDHNNIIECAGERISEIGSLPWGCIAAFWRSPSGKRTV